MGKLNKPRRTSLPKTDNESKWFMSIFAVSFVFALVASLVWDTKLEWWGFIICVLIGVALILPVGALRPLLILSLPG